MLTGELSAYLDFARELALTAGEAILPHFRVPIEIENKGGACDYDPVTEADRGAERANAFDTTIRKLLQRRHWGCPAFQGRPRVFQRRDHPKMAVALAGDDISSHSACP